MSAIGALHCGAGLVTAAVPDRCLETVASFHPAVMTIPLTDDADGSGDPTVVHAFSGPEAARQPDSASTTAPGGDSVSFGFEVTVPARGRAIVMHFASQNADRAAAAASAERLRRLAGSALEGLSAASRDIGED